MRCSQSLARIGVLPTIRNSGGACRIQWCRLLPFGPHRNGPDRSARTERNLHRRPACPADCQNHRRRCELGRELKRLSFSPQRNKPSKFTNAHPADGIHQLDVDTRIQQTGTRPAVSNILHRSVSSCALSRSPLHTRSITGPSAVCRTWYSTRFGC